MSLNKTGISGAVQPEHQWDEQQLKYAFQKRLKLTQAPGLASRAVLTLLEVIISGNLHLSILSMHKQCAESLGQKRWEEDINRYPAVSKKIYSGN